MLKIETSSKVCVPAEGSDLQVRQKHPVLGAALAAEELVLAFSYRLSRSKALL